MARLRFAGGFKYAELDGGLGNYSRTVSEHGTRTIGLYQRFADRPNLRQVTFHDLEKPETPLATLQVERSGKAYEHSRARQTLMLAQGVAVVLWGNEYTYHDSTLSTVTYRGGVAQMGPDVTISGWAVAVRMVATSGSTFVVIGTVTTDYLVRARHYRVNPDGTISPQGAWVEVPLSSGATFDDHVSYVVKDGRMFFLGAEMLRRFDLATLTIDGMTPSPSDGWDRGAPTVAPDGLIHWLEVDGPGPITGYSLNPDTLELIESTPFSWDVDEDGVMADLPGYWQANYVGGGAWSQYTPVGDQRTKMWPIAVSPAFSGVVQSDVDRGVAIVAKSVSGVAGGIVASGPDAMSYWNGNEPIVYYTRSNYAVTLHGNSPVVAVFTTQPLNAPPDTLAGGASYKQGYFS